MRDRWGYFKIETYWADYVIARARARIEFRAPFNLSQLIIPRRRRGWTAAPSPRNRGYQISRCYLLRFARSARFRLPLPEFTAGW